MHRIWITAAVSLLLAGQAQAGSRCNQPYAPVIKANASSMSMQDLTALRDDVQAFMAASDIYQQCVATQTSDNDPRIDANQAEKVKIGREFNDALRAANKHGHPA